MPVEIVGLKGLLALPEVGEVVATLNLLQDLTANAALLTLLTGPRWAIGPRDLSCSATAPTSWPAAVRRTAAATGQRRVDEELADAGRHGPDRGRLARRRPRRPGRGALLRRGAGAVRAALRRAAPAAPPRGEPLLDLVRRIIDTTGVDVELASSVSPAARARRDNLDLFVKGVAEFQAVDGEVSLAALVSYLEAEDEQGTGLDVATPDRRRHRQAADRPPRQGAGVGRGLPRRGLRGASSRPAGRAPSGPSAPAVLPTPLRGDAGDLPAAAGVDGGASRRTPRTCKAHELQEELRLGLRRVHPGRATSSRCRRTCWNGGAQDAVRSVALPGATVRDAARGVGRAGRASWRGQQPGEGRRQPLLGRPCGRCRGRWTRTAPRCAAGSSAAALVVAEIADGRGGARPTEHDSTLVEAAAGRRLGRRAGAAARGGAVPARRRRRGAAALQPVGDVAGRAARRPRRFAEQLARPMPRPAVARRPGSAPGSTPGSRRTTSSSRSCSSTPTSCAAGPTSAWTTTRTCRS